MRRPCFFDKGVGKRFDPDRLQDSQQGVYFQDQMLLFVVTQITCPDAAGKVTDLQAPLAHKKPQWRWTRAALSSPAFDHIDDDAFIAIRG